MAIDWEEFERTRGAAVERRPPHVACLWTRSGTDGRAREPANVPLFFVRRDPDVLAPEHDQPFLLEVEGGAHPILQALARRMPPLPPPSVD
jgi:hypothetical protein